MSSIRISQLASVSEVTDDDVLILNDAGTNTRKITFANFSNALVKTTGDSAITGNLSVSGMLSAGDIDFGPGLITIDKDNSRVGIGTASPGHTLDINGNINIQSGAQLRLSNNINSSAISFQALPGAVDQLYNLPAGYPTVSGQALTSTDNGSLTWTTVFQDPTTTAGDMIRRGNTNTLRRLAAGSFGQVLTVQADGLPDWQTVTTQPLAGTMTGSIVPDTNEQYDLGSATNKIRHLYLSDNSLSFTSGSLSVQAGELSFEGKNLARGGQAVQVHCSFDASAGAAFDWSTDGIASSGVTSVTRLEEGVFVVAFETSFASNAYTVVASAGEGNHTSSARAVSIDLREANRVTIRVERTDTGTQQDEAYIALIAMGVTA